MVGYFLPMDYWIGKQVSAVRDKFYVYGLLDDDGVCFYIGMTNFPDGRLREHLSRPSSQRVKAKLATVNAPVLLILSEGLSQEEARKLEKELIDCVQGLLNQESSPQLRAPKTRHPVFEKYLRTASKV